MRKKKVHIFALMAFVIALPLGALDTISIKRGTPIQGGRGWEQRLEFEAPVKQGARLLLRAGAGAVEVQSEPGDLVKCAVILRANTSDAAAAQRFFDQFQLSVRSLGAGGVYVTSQSPGNGQGRSLGIQFQISVPPRFSLDVETQAGDITVGAPLEGEARLITAGGNVRTADLAGPVRIETAGGAIAVGNVDSRLEARTAGGPIHAGDVKGDANLETSGGEIVIGQVGGGLRAETAAGDVVIAGAAGELVAQTAGGKIHIGPSGGSVRAETAGGSISLEGARGRVAVATAGGSIDLLQIGSAVRASTATGRILAEFDGTKKSFGPSQLETGLGDVFVYLPTDLPLTIDAVIDRAAGHKIVSDFPLTILGENEKFAPRAISGQGALNGGGEVLKIRTVAGNIEIRKLAARPRHDLQQKKEEDNRQAGQIGGAQRRGKEPDRAQPQRNSDGDHDGH